MCERCWIGPDPTGCCSARLNVVGNACGDCGNEHIAKTREPFLPARHCLGMRNDEYELLATAIWQGNTLTIAALQDMTADDVHEVEKAIADLYQADINLNGPPEQIRDCVAKARARSKPPSTDDADLDRAFREANAED